MTSDPRYQPEPFADDNQAAQVQQPSGPTDRVLTRETAPPERQWNYDEWEIPYTGSESAGSVATGYIGKRLTFKARTVIAVNTTGHTFDLGGPIIIPPNSAAIAIPVRPFREAFTVKILTAGTTAGILRLAWLEEQLSPTGPGQSLSAAAAASSVSITAPIGENLEAASVSVTLATDEENIPVNLHDSAGTNIPLGQAAMAASLPVTIANNQSNVPENLAQVGGAAIALGQTTMASSVPVTLASNQSQLPVGERVTALRLTSASATTGVVKNAAGTLKGILGLMNSNAATRYLHLYNKASAPTLSTDTPVLTIPLPAGAGAVVDLVDGLSFGTGIAYAITTDDPAIPTTAGTGGDIQGTVLYL